jgi:hypothetical protein
VDGRCEGGPEEDGCHELEDTCTQKRRLKDGREGGPRSYMDCRAKESSQEVLIVETTLVLKAGFILQTFVAFTKSLLQ